MNKLLRIFSVSMFLIGNALMASAYDYTVEVASPGSLDESQLPTEVYNFDHFYVKGTLSAEDAIILDNYLKDRNVKVFNCKDAYFLAGGSTSSWYNEVGIVEDGTFPRNFGPSANILVMPSTLKKVIKYQNPHSLRILLPEGIEWIEGPAFEFDQISQINLPQSIKHIGHGALYSCKIKTLRLPDQLEILKDTCIGFVKDKIHLPEELKEIRWRALGFYGESLTLPKKLKRIGPDGIYYGYNLKEIHSLSEVPPLCDHFLSERELLYYTGYEKSNSETSLDGVDKEKCILYVPKGCVEAYRNAIEWGDFKNIQEEAEGYAEDLTGFEEWDLVTEEYAGNNSVGNTYQDIPDGEALIYDIRGIRQPRKRNGLNIIKGADGKTKKILNRSIP